MESLNRSELWGSRREQEEDKGSQRVQSEGGRASKRPRTGV